MIIDVATCPAEPSRLRRIYLLPGELHVATEPTEIKTVLGSCVSVCLWDRQAGVGGMTHFVLPIAPTGDVGSTRYGDIAIRNLIEGIRGRGGHVDNLQARVFGGADVLPFGVPEITVGAANLDVAFDLLQRHGIGVVGRRTGGQSGLLVRFDAMSGEAVTKVVQPIDVILAATQDGAGAAGEKCC